MENSANLPPRKINLSANIIKQCFTPLQMLLQMGFNKERAEKALSATGNKNVQLAADWLLAHINDPTLDTPSSREYVVYLCPVGVFLDQLELFWSKSLDKCGWNGAHNSIPHITLAPFFQAPDEYSLRLSRILEQIVKQELKRDNAITDFQLELYASSNFMGYFLSDESCSILKRVASRYVKEVYHAVVNDSNEQLGAIASCFPWCTNSSGKISFASDDVKYTEANRKSFHLTLAYQFSQSDFEVLKELIDNIFKLNDKILWEVRLYSRDAKMIGKHVYKVIYSHKPQKPDELELRIGDFIYVNEDSVNSSIDTWIKGTSWLTGCSGYFPINYTTRTAEVDAWTLHKVVPLCKDEFTNDDADQLDGENEQLYYEDNLSEAHDEDDDNDHKSECNGNEVEIYVMRHGERMDFTFGPWVAQCFTKDGKYVRKDLNMPSSLPERKEYPQAFVKDCPLTNVGIYEATLSGEAFLSTGIVINHVFCSPSLRCVQTCDSFLSGLGLKDKLQICLEPALFEWIAWYKVIGIPEWMTPEELSNAGYNVDNSYRPFLNRSDVENLKNETCEDYYSRSYKFVQYLLQEVRKKGGRNILVVGHATSLDTISRQLIGQNARTENQLSGLIQKIPYCSLIRLSTDSENNWQLTEPQICPVSNAINEKFNWKVLLEQH